MDPSLYFIDFRLLIMETALSFKSPDSGAVCQEKTRFGRQKHLTVPSHTFGVPFASRQGAFCRPEFHLPATRLGHSRIKKDACFACAGGELTECIVSGDGPSPPSPLTPALTLAFLASHSCSDRFQIFLAELPSRRSSREHRAQMTCLLLLPILQLAEGVSSQMFREEGLLDRWVL